MSDTNIPTPEATQAPVTVATKAPKSKGLSIYNRVALILLLILVIATTTLFALAVQKTKAQKNMQAEIQTIEDQRDALAAPAWCKQVTPDNVDKVDELYSDYYELSSAAQEAVKKECKDRVDAVQLLKSNDAANTFTVDSECALDDAQKTLHCSVDISAASDTLKSKLAPFSKTDVTLQILFNQSVLGTPDHVIDDVATATMTNGEKTTIEFTTPFDESWGPYYKVKVTSYFPNA
ncbi:MAG: hypothetical protein KH092_05135 [Actinomyces sp.]|nr:hypothetical protein [Actinomyces sp.]